MKIEFAVQMTCESCVEKVQKALSGLDGISKLDVDLQSNTVMVDTDLPQSLIKDKIEATGMRAVLRGYGQLGAAVAMLGGNTGFSSGNIKGVIRFVQEDDRHCIVDGEIDAPRDTPLSVSIYECGDISNNCANLGDKLVAILDHQNIAPNKETGSILYKLIGKNDSNGKETANILDKFIGTNNSNGKLTKNASGQTVINNERSDTCCSRTNKSENSRNSNLLAGNGGPFNTVNRIGANAESTRENGSQSNALNGASIQAPPSTLTERKSVHGPISDQSSTQTPPTSSVGPMSDENSQAPPTSLILKTRSPIDISGIVGRSLVIEDGANNRLACAVIARSAGVTENKKVICACDGVTIWEERERPLAGPGRRGK
ncbi:hypothetical protein M8J76_011107 [Diaphorina citri]|nr:hypothetical protein M8J75_009726 [Diaphorina citri]KAI5716717.1 hypothetical protein M8J76_011107 [Diaphorina citri]